MQEYELEGLAQLPEGSSKLYEFAGEKYLLYRLSDGFFATSHKCTHLFKSLEQGVIVSDRTIRCPMHRAEFDIRSGQVEKWACFPPGVQLLNAVRPEKALQSYSVLEKDGKYFLQV